MMRIVEGVPGQGMEERRMSVEELGETLGFTYLAHEQGDEDDGFDEGVWEGLVVGNAGDGLGNRVWYMGESEIPVGTRMGRYRGTYMTTESTSEYALGWSDDEEGEEGVVSIDSLEAGNLTRLYGSLPARHTLAAVATQNGVRADDIAVANIRPVVVGDKNIVFHATSPISPGDEIGWDYGSGFWSLRPDVFRYVAKDHPYAAFSPEDAHSDPDKTSLLQGILAVIMMGAMSLEWRDDDDEEQGGGDGDGEGGADPDEVVAARIEELFADLSVPLPDIAASLAASFPAHASERELIQQLLDSYA